VIVHYNSASQIDLYRECQRKWGWRYIARVEVPPKPSALLGTEVDDEQIQPYLRDGRPFDLTRPSGYIAESMRQYLPEPKTVVVQKHFEIPSPSWRTVPFAFRGDIDIFAPDASLLGLPGGVPCVADTKTTVDIGKWAKTESDLRTNVQAMLYATAAMYETGTKEVQLAWIYGQTRGAHKAKRVELRVGAEHVAGQFKAINETGIEIFNTREIASAVEDKTAAVLTLKANPNQCHAYGGCPYQDRCNLSPGEIIEALAARAEQHNGRGDARKDGETIMSAQDLLAKLMAKKAAQGGGAPGAAAPQAATPISGMGQQTAPVPAPPSSPSVPDGIDRAALAAINPPESALAPPPEAPKAPKIGRPKKDANGVTPIPNVGASPATTIVRVVWGQETYTPVPYNSFTVGPFEATRTIPAGESEAFAAGELYDELRVFAETVRDTKAAEFKKALGGK
jgi:hypothetical protein